jgi:Phosphorylase superfamily
MKVTDSINIVLVAPKDFEMRALRQLLDARSQHWLKHEPLGDRYPVYEYAASTPRCAVTLCSTDEHTGSAYARRAIDRLLGVADPRFRPRAFFLCGTAGAAAHLHIKDGLQIGEILLARSALGASAYKGGANPKIREVYGFLQFEESLVGKLYLLTESDWRAGVAQLLGAAVGPRLVRTDLLSSDLMVTEGRVMDDVARIPGLEACEMELVAVAEVLKEHFRGLNAPGYPSLQVVKGISDFVGLEDAQMHHTDANREKAARHSAAATVAFLELPRVRVALTDEAAGLSRRRTDRVHMEALLARVAESVRHTDPLSKQEWSALRIYSRLDSKALNEVLEAVSYACSDACSGCGANLGAVRGVLEGIGPLVKRIEMRPSRESHSKLARFIQQAAALDVAQITAAARRMAPPIMAYCPEWQELRTYRELLFALIYVLAEDFEWADRLATRLIEVTRQLTQDDAYAMMRARRCRLCILSRHADRRAIELGAQLLEQAEKVQLPADEASEYRIGVSLRVFEGEVNLWRLVRKRSTGGEESDRMRTTLLDKGRELETRMRAVDWKPNAWHAGLLVSLAELSGTAPDGQLAKDVCVAYAERTSQKRHCLYRMETWPTASSRGSGVSAS